MLCGQGASWKPRWGGGAGWRRGRAGRGGAGLRRECVRGLGGFPYPGRPRPFPVLDPSARNSFRKIPGRNALGTAGSWGRARPGKGGSLGNGKGKRGGEGSGQGHLRCGGGPRGRIWLRPFLTPPLSGAEPALHRRVGGPEGTAPPCRRGRPRSGASLRRPPSAVPEPDARAVGPRPAPG